jgi:hypothetical protein
VPAVDSLRRIATRTYLQTRLYAVIWCVTCRQIGCFIVKSAATGPAPLTVQFTDTSTLSGVADQ